MNPTVGRIVHYFAEDLADLGRNGVGPYAAIITKIHSDTCVDLQVFPTGHIGEQTFVCLGPGAESGSAGGGMFSWWYWPPRV